MHTTIIQRTIKIYHQKYKHFQNILPSLVGGKGAKQNKLTALNNAASNSHSFLIKTLVSNRICTSKKKICLSFSISIMVCLSFVFDFNYDLFFFIGSGVFDIIIPGTSTHSGSKENTTNNPSAAKRITKPFQINK